MLSIQPTQLRTPNFTEHTKFKQNNATLHIVFESKLS